MSRSIVRISRGCLTFLAVLIWCNSAPSAERAHEANNLKTLYLEYRQQCLANPSGSSDMREIIELPPYRRIASLGVGVLPLLIQDGRTDPALVEVGLRLCSITYPPSADRAEVLRKYVEGRADIPRSFEDLYKTWRDAVGNDPAIRLQVTTCTLDPITGKIEETTTYTRAGELYLAIKQLGVLALPSLVDTIVKNGDASLIPIVQELTHDELDISDAESTQSAVKEVENW